MGNRIDRLEKDFSEERINEIYIRERKRIEPTLDEYIKRYSHEPELLKIRFEDIRNLIFHLNDRINYWENRRSQFLSFAAGILVAALAAIISIINNLFNNYGFYKLLIYLPILIPCISLFIGSILLIMKWNSQNNPSYPFTKGYRYWRWHNRHAETSPLNTNVSSYDVESFENEVNKFIENQFEFKTNLLKSEIKDLIDQDLSQYYLLLINEKFKIEFVSELRNCLVSNLKLALCLLLVSILISIIFLPVNYLDFILSTQTLFQMITPTV